MLNGYGQERRFAIRFGASRHRISRQPTLSSSVRLSKMLKKEYELV